MPEIQVHALGAPFSRTADVVRVTRFDDRYGAGAHARMLAYLADPDWSFARIAAEFGVSRERVRQWHRLWTPHVPAGRRRRAIAAARARRWRVLRSPLFKAFFKHARGHVAPERIALVQTRHGFKSRAVRIDSHVVALRDAASAAGDHDGVEAATYRLAGVRGDAEFVYVRLSTAAFLFLPSAALPAHGLRFPDLPSHPFRAYRNTFHALSAVAL